MEVNLLYKKKTMEMNPLYKKKDDGNESIL